MEEKNIDRNYLQSRNWKHWLTIDDEKRCLKCEKYHGKVYHITENPNPKPPMHFFCRCRIVTMSALSAGTATDMGVKGADWHLKYLGKLPEYYITKQKAESLGWIKIKGNLAEVAPGNMITGGIYQNRNGHLPDKPGRIWYEADINYKEGKRNDERILFSNDGLIFVTYDHYETFAEIR